MAEFRTLVEYAWYPSAEPHAGTLWHANDRVTLAVRLNAVNTTGSLPTRWYQLEPTLSVEAPSGLEWRLGWLLSRYSRDDVDGEDFRAEALVTSVRYRF